MFGLRTKLAVAFGGLLAILLIVGLQATGLITRLGGSIDVILRENYRSVVACRDMEEALERIEGGALTTLAEPDAGGERAIADGRARFEAALQVERNNITLPGEAEKADSLRVGFARLAEALDRFADPAAADGARRAIYAGEIVPLAAKMDETADAILQMNQQNMVASDASARASADDARRRMYVFLVAGSLVALGLIAFLSRMIIRPLERLTQSVREIERGNLDLVVHVPSRDEVGQLATAFNAMATRLRELRRSDQARLLRAQKTSQVAIDSLTDAIAVLSPDGVVELANATARSTFGLMPGGRCPETLAEGVRSAIDEATRPGARRENAKVRSPVQVFLDGKERFFKPAASAIRDAGGELVGVTLVLANVTEERRARDLGADLVSTVSHELRTPLTSIQMSVHILLEERLGALSPAQSDLLIAARDDAERLQEIIRGLLDLARYDEGESALRRLPVEAHVLIESAIAPLRPMFADAGVALSGASESGIPPVLADPERIELVLSNLLRNALQHTPAGGTVHVSAEPRGDDVAFLVTDTGRGVSAEHRARIFDPFFQVPGTEGLGGSGLGLAISKEIVEAHGGAISIESGDGAGTTFRFTIPIAPQQKERGRAPAG